MKIWSYLALFVLFGAVYTGGVDAASKKGKRQTLPKVAAVVSPEASKAPGSKVNHITLDQNLVALTFDDGPHAKLTPIVLDILKKHHVKATFFVQGQYVKAYPDIAKRAVDEGHELGNHTWSHAYLSKVGREKVADQLGRTSHAIEEATGQRPKVMRPPGGYITASLADWVFSDMGMTSVMWDVDTNDWKRPGTSVVVQRAVSGARPGSFILVHDIHPPTVAAVENIVLGLKQRGFTLVTCSEMIEAGKARAAGVATPPLAVPVEHSDTELVPMATPVTREIRPQQAPVVVPAVKSIVPVVPVATSSQPVMNHAPSLVPGAAQPSPVPAF